MFADYVGFLHSPASALYQGMYGVFTVSVGLLSMFHLFPGTDMSDSSDNRSLRRHKIECVYINLAYQYGVHINEPLPRVQLSLAANPLQVL